LLNIELLVSFPFLIKLRDKSLVCYESLLKQINLTNVVSWIFIVYLFYKFYIRYSSLGLIELLILMIISIFSFSITMFILEKFKFSDYKIIKIIQKLVIYVGIPLILSLLGITMFGETVHCSAPEGDKNINSESLNNDESNKTLISLKTDEDKYTVSLDKNMVDNVLNQSKKAIVNVVLRRDGNLSTVTSTIVGSSAAAAMAKATVGSPPVARVAMVGGAAFAAAAGSIVGVEVVAVPQKIVENKNLFNSTDSNNSQDSEAEVLNNNPPSPDSNSDFWVNSPLENEIPLVKIIDYLIIWNVLELSLISLIIFALNYKYIYKFINKIISYLVNKFIPRRSTKLGILDLPKYIEKGVDYNNKFIKFYIIILTIILILMILFNILICSELSYHIDEYVTVYNNIKKSSILFLITQPRILCYKSKVGTIIDYSNRIRNNSIRMSYSSSGQSTSDSKNIQNNGEYVSDIIDLGNVKDLQSPFYLKLFRAGDGNKFINYLNNLFSMQLHNDILKFSKMNKQNNNHLNNKDNNYNTTAALLENCSLDLFIFSNSVNINLNSLSLIELNIFKPDFFDITLSLEDNSILTLYKKYNLIGYQSINSLIMQNLLTNDQDKTQFIDFMKNMIINTSLHINTLIPSAPSAKNKKLNNINVIDLDSKIYLVYRIEGLTEIELGKLNPDSVLNKGFNKSNGNKSKKTDIRKKVLLVILLKKEEEVLVQVVLLI
jgi:hypothetical protein